MSLVSTASALGFGSSGVATGNRIAMKKRDVQFYSPTPRTTVEFFQSRAQPRHRNRILPLQPFPPTKETTPTDYQISKPTSCPYPQVPSTSGLLNPGADRQTLCQHEWASVNTPDAKSAMILKNARGRLLKVLTRSPGDADPVFKISCLLPRKNLNRAQR